MAKNSIFDPTKDGVKADNSGYSSNQIDKMIGESAAALIDDDASGDDTIYSSAKIYSMLPEKTASGAVVTFSDGIEELPIVAGTFNIDANLDGVNKVTVSQSGADTSEAEETDINLPDTCYGGSVKADGTYTKTYKRIELNSLTWNYNSDRQLFYAAPTSDVKLLNSNASVPEWVCDDYPVHSFNEIRIDGGTYTSGIGQGFIAGAGSNRFVIRDDSFLGNVESFTESLTGKYLVYDLETPISSNLTPITLKTLTGENNIWCDTGDSSVNYKSYVPRPE